MDIKNTMCRLSDLTQEQIDSLVKAMPESDLCDFSTSSPLIGVTKEGTWGTWVGYDGPTIVTYDEMMQLLTGKSLGFTKSDLIELAKTETVFVKSRDESYRVYIGGIFTGNGWNHPASYDEGLKHQGQAPFDIIAVYTASRHGAVIEQLRGIGLTQVWERTEPTPAQREMAVLQAKMDELQEQMKVVQAKL